MKQLWQYFLQGLVVIVPIGLTAWLFYAGFRFIDGWLGINIPGVGILVLVVVSIIVGFLSSRYLARQAASVVDRFFKRLPLAKLVYSAVKDLLGAFVGEKKRFDKPVMVDLNDGVLGLGFLTRPSLEALGLPDHVAVYFPQAYNFAGQLVVVPKDRVRPAKIDGTSFMAFIVSAGITSAGAPISMVGKSLQQMVADADKTLPDSTLPGTGGGS